MKPIHLLALDAIVNLGLGLGLLFAPPGLIEALGLPEAGETFYIRILGAVLFGIGIALVFAWAEGGGPTSGLGLKGAISINLSAGIVLVVFMITRAGLAALGKVILWSLAALLFLISGLEYALTRERNSGTA